MGKSINPKTTELSILLKFTAALILPGMLVMAYVQTSYNGFDYDIYYGPCLDYYAHANAK